MHGYVIDKIMMSHNNLVPLKLAIFLWPSSYDNYSISIQICWVPYTVTWIPWGCSHVMVNRHFERTLILRPDLLVKTGMRSLLIYLQNNLHKFYLFIFRERERDRERQGERETSMCSCPSCAPYWRPGLQPRHVPWLGIELATLYFTVQCSIHWATPARAIDLLLADRF